MGQLIFQFPFRTSYYEKDFFVSSNNFDAYKLIESCPEWLDKKINIYGPHGCGKTHLSNILKNKTNAVLINANDVTNSLLNKIHKKKCLIIDDYNLNIDEKLLYTIIDQTSQSNQYIVINSIKPIKFADVTLKDLRSRFESFIDLGIKLPTDDLLKVVITKCFSDKQIKLNIRHLDYILNNIERSYERIFEFVRDVDKESLTSGKSININIIKKVLNQ